jgi:hypothetical protein
VPILPLAGSSAKQGGVANWAVPSADASLPEPSASPRKEVGIAAKNARVHFSGQAGILNYLAG